VRNFQPAAASKRDDGVARSGQVTILHEGVDRGIRLWDKVLLCASHASLTRLVGRRGDHAGLPKGGAAHEGAGQKGAGVDFAIT
jgi:hypothetical protein